MIIMNKPRISEAFVQDIYQTLCFAKREISFEVSTFGGLLFWGDRHFRDLLTPVTFYRFFRGIVNFGTLRLICNLPKEKWQLSFPTVSSVKYRVPLSLKFISEWENLPSQQGLETSRQMQPTNRPKIDVAAFSLLWRYAKLMRTTHISVVTV